MSGTRKCSYIISAPVSTVVHFGGRFDRQLGCNYIGGDISVYDEIYDPDCLSFIEVETIVKTYNYNVGDLIYYKELGKILDEGLRLVSSDHDVLQMVKCHEGEQVVVLYLQSFAVLSSDDELFDIEVDPYHGDNSGASPSSVGAGPSSHGTDSVYENEVVDETIHDTERGKMPMTEEKEHVMMKSKKSKEKAGGSASQPPRLTTKPSYHKAATTRWSASQPLEGMHLSEQAARRASSSQPATGIASRIRARQAERKASQRLRGNVSSGQPAREPIMVDLTIDEASQETRTGVRCAWGNPGARRSQIVSATVASRFKPEENSSRVIVPNIEQALKRIEDKQKKKLPVWRN
ncbi:hypothetical protein CJ030_MR5G001748 [Morella rubra]|uniref:PB1-like domain-containing protein n=1 Tax=Morella rubra TaxID=262757 RepID=A0A6A1VMD2_9ROSI|nr:hypothetical protein CJ030_MR5G001748 [Morella rubra]